MGEECIRSVVLDGPGGPEVLKVGEHPKPFAGPGRVLMKTFAAGLNNADIMQRTGKYSPPQGLAFPYLLHRCTFAVQSAKETT